MCSNTYRDIHRNRMSTRPQHSSEFKQTINNLVGANIINVLSLLVALALESRAVVYLSRHLAGSLVLLCLDRQVHRYINEYLEVSVFQNAMSMTRMTVDRKPVSSAFAVGNKHGLGPNSRGRPQRCLGMSNVDTMKLGEVISVAHRRIVVTSLSRLSQSPTAQRPSYSDHHGLYST